MAAGKKSKPTEPNLEQSITELENLVKAMESGELTLEQSLEHFEHGVKLARSCQKTLTEAEQKIKILMQDIDSEKLIDFNPDENA